jgi:hypothetical protein
MASEVSIKEVLQDFSKLDNCFNFYDWFCSDKALEKRAKSLLSKLKFLVNEGLINPDENYVVFKNNCPMSGSLYDDLRICRISDGDFLGGFCPRTGHKSLEDESCSFWVIKPEYKEYRFKDWYTFRQEVRTNENLRNIIKSTFNKDN